MKLLALILISTAFFPARATPLALKQRVAAAYDHGQLVLSELRKADLRLAARDRVLELEPLPDIILDFWQARLTDGGPPLKVIFLEYQIPDGSGAVEVYHLDGNFLVRAHFDEFTDLTWEF